MPKVSIVIPSYNCAAYVRAAVDSVIAQTFSEWELVLVDDGSTDTTRQVLAPYIEAGRIIYLYQENRGPTTATNVGIRASTGEYITFLDADDLLTPDCLADVVNFMERHPELGYVFTNYEIFRDWEGVCNPSGVDTWKSFRAIPRREVEPGCWIFTDRLTKYIIRHGSFMATSGVTFRRSLLEGMDLFPDGFFFGYDDEFYSRLTYLCVSGYVDRILSRIRNRSDSLRFDLSKEQRNVSNLLRHAEFQKDYFRNDPEIQEILREKIPRLVHDLCWSMQRMGEVRKARGLLRRYLAEYPAAPLRRLLVKNYLLGLVKPS